MSRKTKIGTEVANITRDSDTTFKVKRSRSTYRGGAYCGLLWRPPAQLVDAADGISQLPFIFAKKITFLPLCVCLRTG